MLFYVLASQQKSWFTESWFIVVAHTLGQGGANLTWKCPLSIFYPCEVHAPLEGLKTEKKRSDEKVTQK